MEVRLDVPQEEQESLTALLCSHGITVRPDAPLVLSLADRWPDTLLVRREDTKDLVPLPVSQIVLIQSFGHTLEVLTSDGAYRAQDRLYQLAARLDPEKFLRISNSVIVSRRHIRAISPTLSMKFILTMTTGHRVDVTRSYYYMFKEAFGI